MLTCDQIRTLMDTDYASQRKQEARVGQRYYDGHHDIEKKRIFFVDKDGNYEEDKLKSNVRISHPFHRELTDQAVQYLLSGDGGYMKSDDPQLQAELNRRFNDNEDFTAELYKMLTGVVCKGWDFLYGYKNQQDETCFQHADSLGMVEVRAKDTDDRCEYLIYSYEEAVADKTVRRIQVWDEQNVWYFCQTEEGEIIADDSEELNPRPHTLYQKGKKTFASKSGYGRIPFFRMDNFPQRKSDLFLYKDLIDDYDLMNCGLSNAIQDTAEAYYAVTGYEGDDLDELILNLKAKRAIGIGEGGTVSIQTIDVPVEARKAKMDVDRENIYHFGQGLSTEGLKDTNSTTNIAIKSAYIQLNARCVKLKIGLKQLLRRLLGVVLPEINQKLGTAYDQTDVYFCFEAELPTNALENAQVALLEAQRRQADINTLLNLEAQLGRDILMEQVFDVLNLDYAVYKSKLPPLEDETTMYTGADPIE